MAMLKTEGKHPTVTSCPDCGHDVYPLYSTLAMLPVAGRQHGCLVSIGGAAADRQASCGCGSEVHHLI
jgi:hypothetical protein